MKQGQGCNCTLVNTIKNDISLCTFSTVDPGTNDLASARQKKLLVAESRWSQEWVFAVKFVCAAAHSLIIMIMTVFSEWPLATLITLTEHTLHKPR